MDAVIYTEFNSKHKQVQYNPLHAECHIEFLQEFKMKRAVVNVQSLGKHRVVTLHSAKKIWSESYCICITRL